jgi:AraC-like DNA-binding protein
MHDDPQMPWSIDSLAELAAMSRSAFATRFKRMVGVAPAEYLTDWRMALAKKQLSQGCAVKRIAPDLGYANASALSRVFTQRVGVSPREWLSRSKANTG